MPSVLGIDTGGTFTDFFLMDDGRITVYKRPSTPGDPAQAVLAGLEEMGVRTALITTRGFRDVSASAPPSPTPTSPPSSPPTSSGWRTASASAACSGSASWHPTAAASAPGDNGRTVEAEAEADALPRPDGRHHRRPPRLARRSRRTVEPDPQEQRRRERGIAEPEVGGARRQEGGGRKCW